MTELLLLILLVGLALTWSRLRRLEDRIGEFERRTIVEPPPPPAIPTPSATAQSEVRRAQIEPDPAPALAEGHSGADEAKPGEQRVTEAPPRTLGQWFEDMVAGRLLVWLGGVAILVSGVFLVRYTIEIGLVTPELRMAAAFLLGIACVGAGEYARRGRLLADDPRIAQALVGAGIAILYASVYGSHVLYGLIGAGTTSVAMLVVTAAALGLSLRHGPPTALMGLIGGFLTPLLVGDPDAGAVTLLFYLAVLNLAVFLVAIRQGWGWLTFAAIILSFAWTAFLLAGDADDALAAGVFIILLAVAATLVRPGPTPGLRFIPPLAIGIVQLAFLVARGDPGPQAWGLFGLISVAAFVLASIRSEYRFGPPLALGFAVILLLAKASEGTDPNLPAIAVGITILFGLGGLALALWQGGRLWAGLASIGLAAPLLILRVYRPELLGRTPWGLVAAMMTAGPGLLVWANRGRASPRPPADLTLLMGGSAAALLAGAAVWDLAMSDLIASAWLLLAIAFAALSRRWSDLALSMVSALVTIVAICRGLWMVPEISTAAMTGLVGEPVLAIDLPEGATVFFALALPAVLLFAQRLVMPALPLGARRALPAIAGLFLVTAIYVWFKQAFGLASPEDFVARGMVERTIVTQSLFVLGWLLASGRISHSRVEPDIIRNGGAMLTAIAAARFVWFDLLVHLPALRAQAVGDYPVLNLIVPAYLFSAYWLYSARRRAGQAGQSGIWLAAFLAALIVGTALLVRQAFQGSLLSEPDMPIAEFYGYSLAGLLISIGLLLAGMRLPDKALRLAGLLLLTATIVKVFLVDASELEGLLRILSFLGLGVALIGIARLYGPVLRAEAGRSQPAIAPEPGKPMIRGGGNET